MKEEAKKMREVYANEVGILVPSVMTDEICAIWCAIEYNMRAVEQCCRCSPSTLSHRCTLAGLASAARSMKPEIGQNVS